MDLIAWLQKTYKDSPRQFAGAACGFLCAIFFIVIGFWNSILILLLTFLGLAIGFLAENGWKPAACIERIRGRRGNGEE